MVCNAVSTFGATLSIFALCFFITLILEASMALRVFLAGAKRVSVAFDVIISRYHGQNASPYICVK
jgi:hypothetical protein